LVAASLSWNAARGWQSRGAEFAPNLVLYFGSRVTLATAAPYQELREIFPDASLMGCSTGGQISACEIVEDGINAIAMRFDATAIRTAGEDTREQHISRTYGEAIGRPQPIESYSEIFVASPSGRRQFQMAGRRARLERRLQLPDGVNIRNSQ
jgi:hypothetical protein